MSTLRRDNGIPARTPEPINLKVESVILAGLALWALGLVLTLVIPALSEGNRSWWKWACVAGLALGAFGLVYVRRGRGNAASARQEPNANPQANY